MKQTILTAVVAGVLATSPLFSSKLPSGATEQERLADKVRHELVMLPFYGVFDQMSFSLEGHKVILTGQVTRPTLQSSAGNVVKRIPGVEEVDNRIEVLPLSPNDDRLRLALYRTIFGQASLGRYTLGANPPVRIIVKNGNVTLTGVVINEMDKNLAGLFANQVPGVFSVTNKLVVDKKS
ncbi:BON domain-containing protein [Bryobacter aggregatus]|uniref:BON domain-containing protein n=1 Tax=Bryobacter aggregatus TaxID=360054 RepID=UPI0004E187D5|nr:BON domain-containing protein [Bryobacter aggregatus]